MKRKLSIILTTLMLVFTFPNIAFAQANVPAFPGAEGPAMYITGGRGGDVYEVTNLDDYGKSDAPIPGSLRNGLENKTYDAKKKTWVTSGIKNRTIVFRVSGTIHLKTGLRTSPTNVTIAGQTAPGDGICIADYNTAFSGNNVIVRYLRFRGGFADDGDATTVSGQDMIFDHCSFSWSTDECFSIKKVKNVTVQWCIVSDALNLSNHGKGAHGYGGIWGGADVAFHHNLIANNASRNPRFDRDFTSEGVPLTVDFSNNVIYNWSFNTTYGGEDATGVNMVNNYYKPGPSTFDTAKDRIINPSSERPGNYYINGNYVDGNPTVTADNWNGGVQPDYGLNTVNKLTTQAAISNVTTGTIMNKDSAQVAYQRVLDNAGATLPKRDSLDARLINDAREGKGRLSNTYQEDGGFPQLNSTEAPADSDHDGMPDSWESKNGLNANNIADGKLIASNGYSNLENYLNSITTNGAKNPYVAITSPKVDAVFKTNQDIKIEAQAYQNDLAGRIAKVEFYDNDVKIGETTQAPYTFTWSNVEAGNHNLYAKAIDVTGTQTLSTINPIHVSAPENIDPWKSVDIGSVPIPGSASVDNTAFTISGSGDIGVNGTDSFHYVYQELEENAEMIADISSISKNDNGSKAGFMIRESLDLDSPFAMLLISRKKEAGIIPKFISRLEKAGEIKEVEGSGEAPISIKIVREGNQITGYTSTDNGAYWQKVDSETLTNATGKVYIGMAIDSTKGTSNVDYSNIAKFENTKFIKSTKLDVTNPDSQTTNNPNYVVSGKVSNITPKLTTNGTTTDTSNTDTSNTEPPVLNKEVVSSKILTINSAPYEAVTNKKSLIAGTVNKDSNLTVKVNGTEVVSSQAMTAGKDFSQDITFMSGRNVIEVTAKDAAGLIDTLTYNVIYVNEYGYLVDPNSTVNDGTALNGVNVYKTIGAAVKAIPENSNEIQRVFIKNGTYNEKVDTTKAQVKISLIGESKNGVKITNNLHFTDTIGKDESATVLVQADDFTAENITFENSYDFGPRTDTERRALALSLNSDRAMLKNCSINAGQDTMYLSHGRQYFENCYISGDVDFIYGTSDAFFNNCEIYTRDRVDEVNKESFITAGRPDATTRFGFVFSDCRLTSNAGKGQIYLGRPWGPDAKVVYMNCYMGDHINPIGWTLMGENTPDKANLFEYKSQGPGAVINSTRPQLTDEKAKDYTLQKVMLGSDGWNPTQAIASLYTPQNINDKEDNGAYISIVNNGQTVVDSKFYPYNANFAENITLNEGQNVINVITKNFDNVISQKTINVTYTKNAPVITVASQPEKVVTSPNYSLSASASKKSYVTVKLNGTVIVDSVLKEANENFSKDIVWAEGSNKLEIIATDENGVVTNNTYEINYNKQWQDAEFTVSNLAISNMNGQKVNSLKDVKDAIVSADFKNNASIDKSRVFVLALYDNAGEIVSSAYSNELINEGETKKVTGMIQVPSNSQGYKLKAFVLDDTTAQNLMSNQVELN
jgi:pectin methylesterase-like acyl-CoA thioesterase